VNSVPPIEVLDADAVRARCSPARAVDAILTALRAGLEPSTDIPRTVIPVEHGQLLLMPSAAADGMTGPGGGHVGVKVASVAPANPGAGLPRIQGSYLLFDRRTLALMAIIDGAALTELRTPAVSVAAVSAVLQVRTSPVSIVALGAGPQAVGHVRALRAWCRHREVVNVRHLVRDPATVDIERIDGDADLVRLGTGAAAAALAHADIVICATSAREPLFDSRLLGEETTVIAVGSHEPGAREIDASLCARSMVIVEDVQTACREAGDVVQAIAEGAMKPTDLVPMKAVIDGSAPPPTDRPVLFKSVGMSWEDLVVASALVAP
jgi:ornithine cyclodeaminase/alanine dehydrogenase-like protein (mu-crystallin family)